MEKGRYIQVFNGHTYLCSFYAELNLRQLCDLARRISGRIVVTHSDGSQSTFVDGVHQYKGVA